MTRAVAERSKPISIFYLKKHGFIDKSTPSKSGTLSWISGINQVKNSVGFNVVLFLVKNEEEKGYVKLTYTHTDYNDVKDDIDLTVQLVTTKCNYGGERYWFECPLSSNDIACKRRVGVLYAVGKYFGCRYCANVAYDLQFEGGEYRIGSINDDIVEEAYKNVGRKYYKGKMTKTYLRYLRKRDRLDDSLLNMTKQFSKRIAKVDSKSKK